MRKIIAIPLSKYTVSRKIREVADDIHKQLLEKIKDRLSCNSV
jgi:hypothetical protein